MWRELRVVELSKLPKHPEQFVYATLGASKLTGAHPALEFVLCCHTSSEQHVETLTLLSWFYYNPDHPLRVGSIVKIGRPWVLGSVCDRLLLSLPYPFGPEFEWMQIGQTCVRFMWAVPITPTEAAYAVGNGTEALEQLFERANLNYLDPVRRTVV